MKRRGARQGWQGYAKCVLVLYFVALPGWILAQNASQSFSAVSSEADAARESQQIPRAIELYSRAVQLNPKWPDGWWFLGSLQYATGDYASATTALSHYLELTPEAPPALALRGLCEFNTRDYQAALSDIDKALTLGAANDERNEQILRYHESLLLTVLGRFQTALDSYSYFAKKDISSPELMLAIGLAGLQMPLLPENVKEQDKDLVESTGRAAFQYMSGDEKAAHQAFENLFRRFPTTPGLHYLYGHLMFAADPDLGLAEFRRELEVAPSNPQALMMTAWVLLMQKHPSEALPFAKKAAEESPQSSAAQVILGRSFVDNGNFEGGIKQLQQALALDPNSLEGHIALVKAYSELGRKEDARRERTLCLQLTQDSTDTAANR